jgi:hypothetical protein
MANIQFQISPVPGITNDLIAVIYNTLAPAAEVARQVVNPPHASPHNFNFTGLVVGTYIVKIHQSPDGSTLGNLEHDFWVNAVINTVNAYDVKTFQVGLGRSAPYYDPSNGDNDYINPDLDGLNYTVFKPGYGPLDWAANITEYPGGGFSFTDGQEFSQDEIYTILISNLVTTSTGSSSGPSFPEGVEPVAGDITFTSTHYNKILEVTAATNCNIDIPNLDTLPDGTRFIINTQFLFSDEYDAPFYFVTLTLPAGRFARINGIDHNKVWIGRGETFDFVKFGNYLRMVNDCEPYRSVGKIVYSFGKPPLGSVRLQGGWYLKDQIGRVWEEYVSQLSGDEIEFGTDDVDPDADSRTKWVIGATKLWFPDHGGLFHRPNDLNGDIDFTRHPGNLQQDKVGPAQVNTHVFTGVSVGKTGLPGGSPGVGVLATLGDGGDIDTDSATGTNNNLARTDPWSIITGSAQDGQTRPKNVTVAAYVLI